MKLNPRKMQNLPILPNPAETFRKNLLQFADDPILLLSMNQAKTIWKDPLKFVYDPILPIQLKLHVRKNLLEFADDPILPL